MGAAISGDIYLTAGTLLEIVVGGAGGRGTGYSADLGGGGGGSFVIDESENKAILAVAGGGGGGFAGSGGAGGSSPTGGAGYGTFGSGGAGGIGGQAGHPGLGGFGGGGGGYTGGNGGGNGQSATGGSVTGTTFSGGIGGAAASSRGYGFGGSGGFGGGGGGQGGGGGGGYGGGGGGGNFVGSGGGGGSYDADLSNVTATGGANSGDGSVVVEEVGIPCYLRGTAIRTPSGDVSVERLQAGRSRHFARWQQRAGDLARASRHLLHEASAAARGLAGSDQRRRYRRRPAGLDRALMQAEKLVNGVTIVQVPRERVEYWHVELDRHGIILAEGLPAESYLDQGNRTAFENGGAFVEAHPDFRPKNWAQTCAPLVFDGPQLHEAKAALLACATTLGHTITDDNDLHLIVDGKRYEPFSLGAARQAFVLPVGAQAICLHSRTFVPAHVVPHSDDRRELGIRVNR